MSVTLEIQQGPDYNRDDDGGWAHHAYTVVLRCDDQAMRVTWKQGLGITDHPTAEAVLENLLMDAATVENSETFETWAQDLGYDTDSRKAEKIWLAVKDQTDELRILLGDAYDLAVFPGYDKDAETVAKELSA